MKPVDAPRPEKLAVRGFGVSADLEGRQLIAFLVLASLFGSVIGIGWLMGREHIAIAAGLDRTERAVHSLSGTVAEMRSDLQSEMEIHSFMLSLTEQDKPRYRLMVPERLRKRLERER